MPIRAALTNPTVKRIIALTAVYVLALQALFGAGAQLRVMLSETTGLCTIVGYSEPGAPKHPHEACATHCVGHASTDTANLIALAAIVLAVSSWTMAQARSRQFTPRAVWAFQGRAPPR